MIGILICFGLMLALQLATPFWWWIMLVPFVYCLLRTRSGSQSFWTGAVSAGLLWLLNALFLFLTASEIIAQRVANVLNIGSPIILLIATSLLAALAAGISGSAGYFLKAALWLKD